MLNELSNDPIQAAISRLEKQHEEDKQGKNKSCSMTIVNGALSYFSGFGEAATGVREAVPAVKEHNVAIHSISAVFL